MLIDGAGAKAQPDGSLPAETEAPDWSTLETDLHCPRCEYNLRMLTQARCPECGLVFDWQELIAAAERERECPIFEYQWQRRPVRSALYTVWLAVQPWWLWRTVKLEFEPRIGPLLVLAALAFVQAFLLDALLAGAWTAYMLGGVTNPAAYLRYTLSWSALSLILQTQIAPLLIVLGAIAVYRLTLVRYRIRFVHLVRIAVMAWIGWIWSHLLIMIPLHAAGFALLLSGRPPNWMPRWTAEAIDGLALGIYFASLAWAFHSYLRLSRAWLAAAASLVLATVAITVFTVAYTVYGRRRTFGDSLAPLDEWIPGLQWFCLRVLSSG